MFLLRDDKGFLVSRGVYPWTEHFHRVLEQTHQFWHGNALCSAGEMIQFSNRIYTNNLWMPFASGLFHPPKGRFKLQSDTYIICDVQPSQYIFSTGSGNQNLHVYHHGSRHPGWKTRGFRCPQVERRACRGRLVERTRPRPAPRSEWNFPREFVANGGVVVWTKNVRAELPGAWRFGVLFFWLVVVTTGFICSMRMFIFIFVVFYLICSL